LSCKLQIVSFKLQIVSCKLQIAEELDRSIPSSAPTDLAGQEGLEPPTAGFGDRNSDQLSYCPSLPGLAARHRTSARGSTCKTSLDSVRGGRERVERDATGKPAGNRRLAHGTMAFMTDVPASSAPASAAPASAANSFTAKRRERISRRIGGIAESATLAVDAKAKALKAAGRPVIGFGAGEPDFPTPAPIVEAAIQAAREPKNHRYTPTAGLPELRDAVAVKTARDSGLSVSASQVLVTNGGKQAVYQAFATLLDPGDEVLLPAPFWTTYPEAITLAGGVAVAVRTDESSGFRASVEQLETARTPRTKVLLFCSPSNPTGAVYTPGQVAEIGRWAVEHGIWVVTDEIYEHLVYGDAVFSSMPVVVPELADHCVVLNGVAKTYAMTGWRVGWMIGPTDVIKAATNLQSHLSSNVANVSQRAALAAVSGGLDAVAEMRAAFDRRRSTMVRMLGEIPGIGCPEPQGAFYAFPSVRELLGLEIKGQRPTSSAELAGLVLEEAEVAVVPGEAFGTPGYFRLSYALGDDDLVEGITRLAKLLSEAH
jgi:aspartate aminotransferase